MEGQDESDGQPCAAMCAGTVGWSVGQDSSKSLTEVAPPCTVRGRPHPACASVAEESLSEHHILSVGHQVISHFDVAEKSFCFFMMTLLFL